MGYDIFSEITNQAIKVTLYVASPMLLGALVMGILVSLFQAVTQINEQTLSFLPRLLITLATLVALGPWLGGLVHDFATKLILDIPTLLG